MTQHHYETAFIPSPFIALNKILQYFFLQELFALKYLYLRCLYPQTLLYVGTLRTREICILS